MTQKCYLLSKSLLTKIALIAALMSWGGINNVWADDDPNLEVIFSRVNSENSTEAWSRYIKTYSTEGVTLYGYGYSSATSSFGTYSDISSTRYYADNNSVGNNSSNIGTYYFSVKTTSKVIKKVSFLLTSNSTSSTIITPVLFGWEGTPSATADLVDDSESNTFTNRTYSDAQWYTYDFSSSEKDLREVRIYRRMSKDIVTVNGEKVAQKGSGNTMRIWGVKVWTESVSVAPSTPTISLDAGDVNGQTALTIASSNAESIYYYWSDNSEAPSVGDAAYSTHLGASYSTKVPNVTATKYLHVYGYNEIGTSSIVSRTYNITKYQVAAGLTYSMTSRSLAKSGGKIINTLTNPNSLPVTYSITSNGTGSTIDTSTGEVTVGSVAGVETVTASSAETDDYLAGEATYTVVVRADESDIEAVSPGYVFVGENVTSNGTVKFDAYRLYDNNHILSPNGNNVASNKGSSTFSDDNSHLNCLRVKSSSQDWLVFKVDRPCEITFYAQQVNYSIKVGSAKDDDTYGTIGNVSSATITIPTAGLVYLTGSGSDRFIAGFEVNELTTEVTLASSGWSSYSFGYDLDFANAKDGSDNKTLKAYVLSSLTTTSATLTSVETVPASTGVILKGTGSESYTIPVSVSADAVGTNELSASVTATTVDARSVYVVSGGQLKLFTGTEIPANKAYLEASKLPGEARSLSFVFEDDTTTGISNLEKKTLFDGDFMNLAGQRVKAPSKGFYIVNGKKVIVK